MMRAQILATRKKKGYQGVISGHIHHAEIRKIQGIDYMNCGDWVESCTALTEKYDGTFEIIYWDKKRKEYISENIDKDKFTSFKKAS